MNHLVVIGLSHRNCPVEVRERFAFAEADLPAVIGRLRDQGIASEAVLLSTCNRVELYATTSAPDAGQKLQEFLCCEKKMDFFNATGLYAHAETDAVEHLFRVAAGLDSLVLGETEILGQLKKAYDISLQAGHTGKLINKAFQKAFSVAKQIRSDTQIQRGSTSVGSVAVELAEKLFSEVRNCDVMVIGAGDTAEKTARALHSRGARSLMVSNRSHDRAVALAAELGGRALHFDDWEAEFARVDIIISSTSAPHYILDLPRLQKLIARRGSRPLMLVDIAVPRDIDPRVDQLDNVFLYDIDDLQAIAGEYLRQRQEELSLCERIIREKAIAMGGGVSEKKSPGELWPHSTAQARR